MSYIRITRYPYLEPHTVDLVLEMASGWQRTLVRADFSVVDLQEIGSRLATFPMQSADSYSYENISEKDEDEAHGFSFFRLRAFTSDGVGSCAIQIRTNNNRKLPRREVSEFCILAEPSQINRLGTLLGQFSKLEHQALEWTVTEGRLIESST